jgi:hypothetical protein
MTVSGNYVSGRDTFDGTGIVNGQFIPQTGGRLASIVPLQWSGEGLIRSNGYIRRLQGIESGAWAQVLPADIPDTSSNPWAADLIRNLLLPQGSYARVETGFNPTGSQVQMFMIDYSTCFASNISSNRLARVFSLEEPVPENFRASQSYVVVEQICIPSGTEAWTQPAWAGIFNDVPGAYSWISANTPLLALGVSYFAYEFDPDWVPEEGNILENGNAIAYMFLFPAHSRPVVEVYNDRSKFYVKQNPSRYGFAVRMETESGDIPYGAGGSLSDLFNWERYQGPFPPRDLLVNPKRFPHLYNPSWAIHTLAMMAEPHGPDWSYPRIYDYQFRAGSLGGWKVGMI